jgi:hypothetical protein
MKIIDTGAKSLISHILYQTNLLKTIIELLTSNVDLEHISGNMTRKGYTAVLIILANKLVKISETNQEVKNTFDCTLSHITNSYS